MSAQRGVRLPLSDAVLEPNFRETLAPGKTRFCRINFRLQRLNGFSQRPSEKIPMQLIPDAMSFPMRVTPNCPEGLRRFFNWNQFQSLNFLQKKRHSFVRTQKSATNFLFQQTSSGVISEPSSKILTVKSFRDRLIFREDIASFPYPR